MDWCAMQALMVFRHLTGRTPESMTVLVSNDTYSTVRDPRRVPHRVPAVEIHVDSLWLASLTDRHDYNDACAVIREKVTALGIARGYIAPIATIRQCPAPAGGCDL